MIEPGKKQIEYIKLYTPVLLLENLSLSQKVLFCLILNSSGGLRLGNDRLGKLLGITPTTVSRLLSDMLEKQYIKIDLAQSKYRRAYFDENSKVGKNLLCSFQQFTFAFSTKQAGATLTKTASYFDENSKHNKKNKYKSNEFYNKTACAEKISDLLCRKAL